MQIVHAEDIPLLRGLEHRGGIFHSRRLLEGEPGTIDNFQLTLGEMGGDFFSPRHRHNFEQVRLQIDGTLDYARDGKLSQGMVGYFPEGMRYGPQTQDPDEVPRTLVLQFGGASGSGYMSRGESKAAVDALCEIGEFENGVFRRNDDVAGKRNTDGFQAIWEHVHGRKLEFPEPRYPQPIMMDPARYEWLAVPGEDGVQEKPLGTFSECRTEVGFLRLAPGASHEAGGRGVYFVVSGAGAVADGTYTRHSSVFVDRGETAQFTAEAETVIFHVGLPDLSALAQRDNRGDAVAAE